MKLKILMLIAATTFLHGCTTVPLSQRALGVKLPVYHQQEYDNHAEITFSSDKKYESEKGVPLKGEPLICTPNGLRTTYDGKQQINPIFVPAGEEVILTSIISWENTGWTKTCWPFVKFVPEAGARYVVVNERIGGKGVSALWTGVAFQSCEISVFEIDSGSFKRIESEIVNTQPCGLK